MLLEVKDLKVQFGKAKAVNGVSLNIEEGEIMAPLVIIKSKEALDIYSLFWTAVRYIFEPDKMSASQIRLMEQHLKQQGALIFFPAGEVSRLNWQGVP